MRHLRAWLLCFMLLAPSALAHVGYVLDDGTMQEVAGADTGWFLTPLTQPIYVGLMLLTLVIVLLAYILISRSTWFRAWHVEFVMKARTYEQFLPWIARLGLGIALIGAGTAGVLISPIQPAGAVVHTLQILLGFLLLAGFLTGAAALLVLALYVSAALTNGYLFGNLDIGALCVALLVLASGRPGIDDLLGIRFLFPIARLRAYVPLLLRIGIGVAMTFLAVYEKILNPHWSAAVVAEWGLQAAIPVSVEMWVFSAGIVELAVGLALLLGYKTRLVAAIAFCVLSASFFYFNEAVYSHITLFATLSMLFITGGGKWSLDAPTPLPTVARRRR